MTVYEVEDPETHQKIRLMPVQKEGGVVWQRVKPSVHELDQMTAPELEARAAFAAGAAALAAPFCFLAADHALGRLPLLRNELDIVAAGLLAFVVYVIVYVLGALAFGRSARKQLL